MPIQLKRVAPIDFREPIVDFLWRIRTWPYSTKDEYFRYWDWRYSSLSELEPVVWVALEGDAVVGHVAVNFRDLQVAGQAVRVGIPANFRVEDRYRTIVGALLTRSIQSLVRSQQVDMLLGYSNAKAHAIARAVGFREIGLMRSFVEVRKWGPVLARRVPGGAALAPIARVITGIQRSMRAGCRATFSARLAARELSVADLSSANRLHWPPSKSLVWNGKLSFLSKRFLECPVRTYRVIGIFDESNDRLEGYVVTEGNDRMNIVQCDVNETMLSEVAAVQLGVAATPDAEVVIVALLPQSDLAHQFTAAGFALRSIRSSDEVLRETTWSAYSRPDHALARDFEAASNWKLWYGWNNH